VVARRVRVAPPAVAILDRAALLTVAVTRGGTGPVGACASLARQTGGNPAAMILYTIAICSLGFVPADRANVLSGTQVLLL
jgi:hypothetical protein